MGQNPDGQRKNLLVLTPGSTSTKFSSLTSSHAAFTMSHASAVRSGLLYAGRMRTRPTCTRTGTAVLNLVGVGSYQTLGTSVRRSASRHRSLGSRGTKFSTTSNLIIFKINTPMGVLHLVLRLLIRILMSPGQLD
eukprot:SAG31_NODE_7267_length_1737_cov_6.985958_1_plen_135_part_00